MYYFSGVAEDLVQGICCAQARVRDSTDITSSLLVQARGRDAICDSIRDAGCATESRPRK